MHGVNAAAARSRGGRAAAAAAAVRRGVAAESSLRRPATINKSLAWPVLGSRSAACSGSVQAGLETNAQTPPIVFKLSGSLFADTFCLFSEPQ